MKKYLVLIFTVLLSFCFVGCNEPAEPVDDETKPTLIFQIDEGIRNLELLGQYSDNFGELDAAVDRITAACSPLKEKYDIVYHIYAHYHYRTVGFGGDATQPENRLSAVLKHFMNYMSEKGEQVLIEAYSSGVGTHQTGDLDTLPTVPVYYGDAVKIAGFTMDVDCIDWIAKTYPSFYGVRFHELIGSNDLGGMIQSGNEYARGFKVNATAIEAVIDTMKANGKKLVWGDHSWDKIYSNSDTDFWLDLVNYGIRKIGENLVINSSNNCSGDTVKNLSMKPYLKAADIKGASIGFSVQTWLWQEADTTSYSGYLGLTKWYVGAYMDMPVELMAASSLKAIENGASVIQYEPTEYFFNARPTHVNAKETYGGFTENGADYSPRVTLKYFIDLMTEEDTDKLPSMDPLDYYTSGDSKLAENLENNPPDKFFKTTLGVLGEEKSYFDTYNYAPDVIFNRNENRFLSEIFDGAVKAERINLTFGGVDEFVVLKNGNGNLVGDFYYHNSVNLGVDGNIFADNENGRVIDFVSANLIREYVNNLDNDPDELILAREKDGIVKFEVYRASDSAVQNVWAFRFEKAENSDSVLTEYLGMTETSASGFIALSSYRFRNVLHSDSTRSYDSIAVLTRDKDALSGRYLLKNSTDTEGETKTLGLSAAIDGEIIDVASGDLNQDRIDEIILLVGRDGKYYIETLTVGSDGFAYDDTYSFGLDGSADVIFTLRHGTYYKQSLFLASEK
ncbi:MAG: hypothetical protein ACI4S9_00330 [Christensenellales bacterium]